MIPEIPLPLHIFRKMQPKRNYIDSHEPEKECSVWLLHVYMCIFFPFGVGSGTYVQYASKRFDLVSSNGLVYLFPFYRTWTHEMRAQENAWHNHKNKQ